MRFHDSEIPNGLPKTAGLRLLALMVCLLSMAWCASNARAVDLQLRGTWGGEVRAIFMDESEPDIVYISSGRRLAILQMSDDGQGGVRFNEIGSLDMGNLVSDVAVRGDYAYVASLNEPSFFAAVDIQDRANPQWIWSEPHSFVSKPEEIDLLEDGAALVRTVLNDIVTYDLNTPEMPDLQTLIVQGDAEDSAVVGDTLFVATRDRSLEIYDITNPFTPTPLSEVTLAGQYDEATAVVVANGLAYVTTRSEDGGLSIIDVSDPQNPFLRGSIIGAFQFPRDIEIVGDIAYIADPDGTSPASQGLGVAIVDVSDPDNPAILDTFRTHAGATSRIKVYGNRAFLGDYGEGLIVADISVPTAPQVLGKYHSPAELREMKIVDSLLYVTDAYNGLTILDVSDMRRPNVVGVYQTAPDVVDHWGIDVHDGRAYFAAGRGGFEVLDVQDPSNPVRIGVVPFSNNDRAMALYYDPSRQTVTVGASSSQFINYDVSDPGNIAQVGFLNLAAGDPLIRTIEQTPDGLNYVALGSSVTIVDNTTPTSPFITGTIPVFTSGDVAVRGHYCFIANESSPVDRAGLYVEDVSNPMNPTLLSFTSGKRARGVDIDEDGYVYLVEQDPGAQFRHSLLAFDIFDPFNPQVLDRIVAPAQRRLRIGGNHAYVTSISQGLTIYSTKPLRGDIDDDGSVTMTDVPPFIAALLGEPPAPGIIESRADLTGDGLKNGADIPFFVDAIMGVFHSPTGACCLPSDCVDGVTRANCFFELNGNYQGNGTTCDVPCPVGACCLGDGTCNEATVFTCDSVGGLYQGDNTTCQVPCPTGACCSTTDGSCSILTEAECLHEAGLYQGDDTTCDVPCPVGACCSETDGSCTIRTEDGCLSTGDTYLGQGTVCETDPPSCPFGQYSNTIDPVTQVAVAGSGLRLADDLTLAGVGARELTYMDLRVFGNGGGPFDVTIALYTDCLGDGGTQIPGTVFSFSNIPDDGFVYTLVAAPVSPSVTIPDTVWMLALFSTPQAGWVIAEEAEVGSTENRYGRGTPWSCNNTFAGAHAGLWANLRCAEGGARSAAIQSENTASPLRMIRVETEASLESVPSFGSQGGNK